MDLDRIRPAGPGLLFLAVLPLAGCGAVLPENHALTAPKAIETFAADRSLAGRDEARWPETGWWRGYGDRQLTALIEEGLADAPDIAAARARLALAGASVSASRAGLMPRVGASAKIDREKQSYNYLIGENFVPKDWREGGLVLLDASWEIDFWGKNRAALAAATSEARAAEAEAESARLLLSSAIAGAYAELAVLHAERDAAREAVDVRTQTLGLIRDRHAQALENEGALERAKSAEASTRAQAVEIDERIALARNALAALVGAGPDRALSISRPKIAGRGLLGLPKSLPAELVGRRPDIVAARERAEAAAKRIDVAKAAFYPNVNLVGSIGQQSLGLDRLGRSNSSLGSIGPTVSLPIFEGGRLVAGQKASEAEYALSVATYDSTVTRALREVSDAVVSKRKLVERLAETSRAETAAERAWRVESDRYKGGLATYLEVLSAEEALIGSRRAASALRASAFGLDVQLIRALGGGYRPMEKTP